jgi:NTP pyrophosphatase (non-canonical NTP hydrolase)
MSNSGLTKLIEECGELTQVAAKKIAYFQTDEHPDGKGSLKARIEDEMGDVLAAIGFVGGTLNLDQSRIAQRAEQKTALYLEWHTNLNN